MEDDIEEVAVNQHMFQNVIDAHNTLSPGLQFVAFAGGTRVQDPVLDRGEREREREKTELTK